MSSGNNTAKGFAPWGGPQIMPSQFRFITSPRTMPILKPWQTHSAMMSDIGTYPPREEPDTQMPPHVEVQQPGPPITLESVVTSPSITQRN